MKKWISSTAICLLATNLFAQAPYFVDGINGDNANNGTSLATAWKTIQKAANSTPPNSTVMIKGGTYHENIVMNVSGTAGQPITFQNYAEEEVLIDGTGTAGNTMLSMTNKNHLRFMNLTIQNKTVNEAQGILVETTGANTSTGLSFDNIRVRNINWTASAATIPTDTDNAQAFIIYGRDGGVSNLTISDCEVSDNILGFSEAISLDGNIDGFTIIDCKVHDNTNIGIGLIGNYGTSTIPATDHTRNGIVSGNTCYRNVSLYATSGGIYVDGGSNIVVEKNTCYENGNGIEVGCEEDEITVRNNVLFNNENVGLYVGGYTTETTGQVVNCVFRNNTLFRNNSANDEVGEINLSKVSNSVFENNVIYTSAQRVFMSVDEIAPQSGNTFNYNLWYTPAGDMDDIAVFWGATTYETFAAYQAGTSQESQSLFANPQFSNDVLPTPNLSIAAASPAVDAGNPATVIGAGETDYAGQPRFAEDGIDIGAFEWNSASAGIADIIAGQTDVVVFPNPFESATTISLSKALNDATLKVYDLRGAAISTLKNLDGQQITLERGNLTSGIYVYEVTQAGQVMCHGKLAVR
jgi:parallel beta-helix repeat protein